MVQRSLTRPATLVVTLVLASLLTLAPTTPAAAAGGDTADYLARVNSLRASVGVGPLTLDPNLSSLAQAWAQHMADAGAISHAPDLSAGVTSAWTKLGENVGSGPDTAHIFNAFVKSAGHYANLVDPAFTNIGIGVVWVGNTQYTVHRFMAAGGVAPAPPPPTEAPAPRSVPNASQVTTRARQAAPTTSTSSTPPAPDPGSDQATDSAQSDPAAAAPSTAEPARVAAVLDALHSLGA